MKLNVGKRILMFLHWLLSLLICAALVVYLVFPDFATDIYNRLLNGLGLRNLQIVGGAVLAIYVILAVVVLCIIFKRGKRADRGFITMDSSETGRSRIAISAIEQMVRQSVHSIDGISDMKIAIDNQDDAIVIRVNASIVNGSHVPTITMNMQNAIRKFVEMNCGVAVRSVLISINSVTNAAEAPKRRRVLRGRQATAVPAAPTTIADEKPAEKPVETPSEPAVVFTPAVNAEPATTYEREASVEPAAREEEPAIDESVDESEPADFQPAAAQTTGEEIELEGGYVLDPDYKPTLTLDPFGDHADEAKAPETFDEEELRDDADLL